MKNKIKNKAKIKYAINKNVKKIKQLKYNIIRLNK